jgi:hypothetical protein
MTRVIALCALTVACVLGPSAKGQSFTLEQALSAPFASELVASQKTGSLAWVENEQGKRNLWIATRDGLGKYASRRLTSYDQDDGQGKQQVSSSAGQGSQSFRSLLSGFRCLSAREHSA